MVGHHQRKWGAYEDIMRYICDIPGLESDYVELSDAWSRAEVRQFWKFQGEDADAFMALIQRKIVAMHLSLVDAEPLTTADQFTSDNLDLLDYRAFEWLRWVPLTHVRRLGELGEAARLRLFENTGESATPVTPSPTP